MTLVRSFRYLGAMLALSLTCGLASGCVGFSEEEAVARCDQEQEARAGGGCFTLSVYATCVAAFEECGDDVQIGESCPTSYTCAE